MRVVSGENAFGHPRQQQEPGLRLHSCHLKRAAPEQAQAAELGDGEEDVRRSGEREADRAGRCGKRHARLGQRTPIADAGGERKGQFLGGGAASAVPGMAACKEWNEGREMLADMEGGIHVIGKKRVLLRRALAAQRKSRQRIEAGRARYRAFLRRQHKRRVRERRSGRHEAGYIRPQQLSEAGRGLDAQAGIQANGPRTRAAAGNVRPRHLASGKRLHHVPAPRAEKRRPGLGTLIERLGYKPFVKLGSERAERCLGQGLVHKGQPFGLGGLRKAGGKREVIHGANDN